MSTPPSGDGPEPVDEIIRARRADPPPALRCEDLVVGWAYHVLGFETEAKDYVGRALALAPEPEEIREHARALGLKEPGSLEEQA